jgi:hypothetical protein
MINFHGAGLRVTLLLLLAAAVGRAEELRLSGIALDPSGASIGNAVVELSGPHGIQCTQTDERGEFSLELASPGDYELRISAPHFEACIRSLTVDRSIIDIVCELKLQEQTASIEVIADAAPEASADPAANADQVEIATDTLQQLPALDGDVVGALSGLLMDGSFGSEGGGLVVDGMETSDLGVSPSAIQEIRINKDPYSAEFSRPGNARIEVITKSGAESLHGQVNFRLRNYLLDARNAFASERPEQRRLALEGNLVGPIGAGGRHSFVFSGEHDRDRESAIVFATTLDGFVRQTVLAPENDTEMSARWDFHPNYEQALSLRYEFEQESEKNSGVGGFGLPEVASNGQESDHGAYWSYRKFYGASSLLSWTGRVGRQSSREWSLSDAPRLVVADAFTSGGAQRDSTETELYAESAGIFSVQRGAHSLRAGVLLRDLERTELSDRGNFGGTFRFATLADFEAGRPVSYSIRAGDPSLRFWSVAVAGFVQDNIRVNQRSTLAFGVRYDRQNYGDDPDNIAPRASFAVSLGAQSKTTIRVGGGIFYDNINSGAYEDRLRFDGVRIREFLLRNPAYPAPQIGDGESLAPNLVTWAPRLSTPYVGQYSANVERRLPGDAVLAVNWTRTAGVGLLRSRDLNAPLPALAVRPNPEVGIHRQLESSAREESQSLSAQLRGRLSEFFQGTIRYRWGRAYSNVADDDELPANSRDLSGEWGPARFDRRHALDIVGSFYVRNWFQLGVVLEADSAAPYTLTTGQDENGDGLTGDRPGGVSRNTLRGAATAELDVRLSRTFEISAFRGEGGDPTELSLTIDAFNILNTVNPGGFVGNMSSPLFGQATSAGSARRLQAGLRWSF